MSAPIHIQNRQLIGYAVYHYLDGSIMGDPANLSFTALCVKLGWVPPEDKSEFDVLPLLISNEDSRHENPKIFDLPCDAVAEVQLEHPELDLLSELNLQWYVLPAISSMGIDIGDMMMFSYKSTELFSTVCKEVDVSYGSSYSFRSILRFSC
eukprot:3374444-Ditylum_brightwellii.AAC.1